MSWDWWLACLGVPVVLLVCAVLVWAQKTPAKGKHAREARCTSHDDGRGSGEKDAPPGETKPPPAPAAPPAPPKPPLTVQMHVNPAPDDPMEQVNPSLERLATTGELRKLAEDGAMEDIKSDNAAFMAMGRLKEWIGR